MSTNYSSLGGRNTFARTGYVIEKLKLAKVLNFVEGDTVSNGHLQGKFCRVDESTGDIVTKTAFGKELRIGPMYATKVKRP